MKGKPTARPLRVLMAGLGLALMTMGALLLVAGFYFAYGWWVGQKLGPLNSGEQRAAPLVAVSSRSVEPLSPVPSEVPLAPQREALKAEPLSLAIPSLKVEAPIQMMGYRWEDGQWTWETPNQVVGRYSDAVPGQEGNIVLAGHISSPLRGEGNLFRRLPEIELGAEVVLTTERGEHRYVVTGKQVVKPTDVWAMAPTQQETVTLITCVPDWVYTERLVVTARPMDEAEGAARAQ